MELCDYSDKSFKLSGEETRAYKEQLKDLGGRYNPRLQGGAGWIFKKELYDKVQAFVDAVSSGEILPDVESATPVAKASTAKTSVAKAPARAQPCDPGYQTVTYRVVKPRADMKVLVKMKRVTTEYTIDSLEEKNGVIEEVTIYKPDSNIDHKLVIINGAWKMLGIDDPHTVEFVAV